MDLGWGEILLIGFVALLVYGGRLPEVARSVGRTVASLKAGLRDATSDVTRDLDPGLDDALRAARTPGRAVVRAPRALATEDVSGAPQSAPPPGASASDGPGAPPSSS